MSNYKALYRKWRPSTFSDVIGQEHITTILKNEIMSASVSHAYLFCGSRGTGKTTCAKILSKAVSCENPQDGNPCGTCPSCLAAENTLDIYEIDAASHNGVDNIRDLRDTVVYPPSEMKRRVYIIDEVHMLSDGAFNALLKTLEEPPAHALFILATTELRKIPATILSRCKRFDFHRITPEKICERLRKIADEEKILINNSALMLISRLAAGAMRDALSMLELFYMSDHEVDENEASERLGVVGRSVVFSLLDAICKKNSSMALDIIALAYDNSKDLSVLCSELSDSLRDILIAKYSDTPGKLIDATDADVQKIKEFSKMLSDEKIIFCSDICEDMQNRLSKAVFSRRTIIETGILKMCEERLSQDVSTLLSRISALEEKMAFLSVGIMPNTADTTLNSNIKNENTSNSLGTNTPKNYQTEPATCSNEPIDIHDAEKTPQKNVAPKPISPRPLAKKVIPKENANNNSNEERKPMTSFAEFIEEVDLLDKITASMLDSGRAFFVGENVCEIELSNPIATMLLSKDEKITTLENVLAKLLGTRKTIKLKLVKNENEVQKTDLSSLL